MRIASTLFSTLTPENIRDILCDRATSYWLKKSYDELLRRDQVDALNDAYLLCQAMQLRWDALQVSALRCTAKQSGDCGDR